ncbi:MOSC domain-containing protein [Hellea sp.]|nr:MOSC domain-containing protein [Hellea sp.]
MSSDVSHSGKVEGVCISPAHSFSKQIQNSITLLEGLGVEGDAHLGKTVKHRSRVAVDPTQPNLRQVHLIHAELHDELIEKGFSVGVGVMGENITTRNIDLLGLPRGSRLSIGTNAVVEITGLRNPCKQIEDYQKGLLSAVLDKGDDGELIRKSGVMGIVVLGGEVQTGDEIKVSLPNKPHLKLERV